MRRQEKRNGFSLVELLVVIAIISILSTVAGVALWPAVDDAKVSAVKAQISEYKLAVNRYRSRHAVVPTQRQGLAALYRLPTVPPVPEGYPAGGYMDNLVMKPDPWGHDYLYFAPGRHQETFEIVSYGADGEEGGEGLNADISSSNL